VPTLVEMAAECCQSE